MSLEKVNLMLKSMLGIYMLVCSAGELYAATMDEGLKALNAGQLRTAQGVFEAISNNPAESMLNRAIACKNLGTVLFRSGKSSEEAFEYADRIFEELLKKNNSSEIKEQYGYMLYQRANCLLSACENQLSKAKMQGISAIPFEYLKKYISPATNYLNKAKQFYSQKNQGDIFLLELDLLLCETHVWTACHQDDSANRSRNKALNLLETALKGSSFAADTKKKLLLRKATLLCESAKKNENIVLDTLKDAIKIESGNIELDISVFTFYAKYTLTHKNSFTSAEYTELGKQIQNFVAKIETLREQNLKNMDFVAKKNYFATRTELYEVLLMLYAKQNRPFDMLLAINQVRSRAIQDEIDAEKITTVRQLQDILETNKGMLLAYYVGCDHIWSVCFTGNKAKISISNRSGQELSEMCRRVIGIYADSSHPHRYWKYKSLYKPVPQAFEMSFLIYSEIFKDFHEMFKKDKLYHLYIIPHNVLNYLPFSTLVTKANFDNIFLSKFVADDVTPISYFTSVNCLLTNKMTECTNAKNFVFARGDYSFPAVYNDDPDNPDNPNASPINLENATTEGNIVAKLLNIPAENTFTEKGASEWNLIHKTKELCSIVHIASHAHLNMRNPLDSYVVLAAGNGYDGKVTVNELLTMYKGKIHVDLLVLSACDTNRGEGNIMPGDDIAALSNAFLVAGAANVIATEWPASDTSFPKIMEMFYINLTKGMSKDLALAYAIKVFISQDQVAMRYPIFWGNIVLSGRLQKK